jgi:2-hydroxy-6-oxonona-2,4-dienedioate hydrolase
MNKRRAAFTIAALAVLLTAVAAWWVTVEYQRDMRRAREHVAGSELAQTRCGPIEYASSGNGPPVLIVHGAGGGFDQGMGFAQRLVEHGFRVIAVSRFGYLRTPLPADASAEAQADAHACLMDALQIDRAALIGASAGAPSSMQFALRHPERCAALVLLVPAVYAPRTANAPSIHTPTGTAFLFDTALRSDFLYWAATRVARRTIVRALLATPPEVVDKAQPQEQARVAEMIDSILPISPRRLGLVNDARVTSSIPRYDLERIAAPTLLISMADDLFGTYDAARYSAQHIPRARFIGYAVGGHVWVGHQNDVTSQIASFVRSTFDTPANDQALKP